MTQHRVISPSPDLYVHCTKCTTVHASVSLGLVEKSCQGVRRLISGSIEEDQKKLFTGNPSRFCIVHTYLYDYLSVRGTAWMRVNVVVFPGPLDAGPGSLQCTS